MQEYLWVQLFEQCDLPHSHVLPVLTTMVRCSMLAASETFVCLCQPLCSPGWHCLWEEQPGCWEKWVNQQNVRGTLFFAWASEIHFYSFRPKGFFTLWRLLCLFFVITALVIASFCFQTLCKLWPFLLSPIWYEEVNSLFLFTYYDNFSLYCQTITLFFTPYSLIHKLILR